ncbi:glycosyltransferase [Gluconobacter kondonii]|uniref:glycosyltransferase family 2 protein n=1 Tax=Gluconobacter kondonii TaxID=941463 RepID=UPI00209CB76A|nr:glycosyltransferase [Gluconobacter kondonii]MCP1237998.1 glycosyltransferase [Gluconobacter kondonii]
MDNINWNYSIDSIKFTKDRIKIDGWVCNLFSNEVIESIFILYEDGNKILLNGDLLKNSKDVEDVFGECSKNSRFTVFSEYPPNNLVRNLLLSKIEFKFLSGKIFSIPTIKDRNKNIDKFLPRKEIKIGVGVTTFNRFEILVETINKLKMYAICELDIVICDDGSVDNTKEITKIYDDISYICGKNKGIAWNKNRALYYLHTIQKCDVVILMEDDVVPNGYGWDLEWSLSSLIYGHINYLPSWIKEQSSGTGLWYSPYVSKLLSGQCSAFSRYALSFVGFIDTRFKRYGHEHVEHTLRMIRAGFGGKYLDSNKRDCNFFSIEGSLETVESTSTFSEESVKENSIVFDKIWNESIYRMAWRNDEEMMLLKSEIDNIFLKRI